MEIEGYDVAYPAKPASTLQSCHFFMCIWKYVDIEWNQQPAMFYRA